MDCASEFWTVVPYVVFATGGFLYCDWISDEIRRQNIPRGGFRGDYGKAMRPFFLYPAAVVALIVAIVNSIGWYPQCGSVWGESPLHLGLIILAVTLLVFATTRAIMRRADGVGRIPGVGAGAAAEGEESSDEVEAVARACRARGREGIVFAILGGLSAALAMLSVGIG